MLTLDHLVILVADLDQAVADYMALGFTVTPGGTHADGLTHNALVVFADGTYLELIAFLDPHDPRDNAWGWRQFASRGGLIDVCLAADDLIKEIERLRQRGLPLGEPSHGGRTRSDGTELRWRSGHFEQPYRVLPFLIEDVTPRSLRVPADQIQHVNGAQGIATLAIAVPDLDAAAAQWADLLGAWSVPISDPELDARIVAFDLNRHSVRLAAPQSDHSAFDAALPGPYAVTLATTQLGRVGWLDLRHTHGARIAFGGA